MLSKIFENILFNSRFIIILAVIFSLIGSIILFIVASIDIWGILVFVVDSIINNTHPQKFHEKIVSVIIGSIDLYLIAVVMIIFAFGLYKLFILDTDEKSEDIDDKVLSIKTLDQLKDKIAKVIIMVLVVSFFQRVLYTDLTSALDMLYFALSICALSVGLYFLGKVGK